MTAWCENATTGVLRRTGGVQVWPEDGAGRQGTLQEDGHSCVTTGVLRRTARVQSWPEDRAGSMGTLQDDGHRCVTTGLLRRTGGVRGWLSRGQRDRERSRRMVSGISLCGSMCHCDRALARLERTGRERAVSLKS